MQRTVRASPKNTYPHDCSHWIHTNTFCDATLVQRLLIIPRLGQFRAARRTWRRGRTSGARIPCRNVIKKPFHQRIPDSACRQAKLLRNDTNILNLQRLELRPKTLCATALHDTAQPCNRFLHFDLRTNPACELFLQANPLHGHAQLRS